MVLSTGLIAQAKNQDNPQISPRNGFMRPQQEDNNLDQAYPEGVYYMQGQADQAPQPSEDNAESSPTPIRRCGTPAPQSTSLDSNNLQPEEPELFNAYFNEQPQGLPKKMHKMYSGLLQNSPRPNVGAMQAQVTAAIGSDISYTSIAAYAQQLSPALASLSTSSTPDEIQAVQDMVRNIGFALRQLNPQANSSEKMPPRQSSRQERKGSRGKRNAPVDNSGADSSVVVQMRNSSESEESQS